MSSKAAKETHAKVVALALGEFIKKKRKAKNMSIRLLAMDVGCSNTHLSLLEKGENGRRGISPVFLRRLVKPLGVTYEELLEIAGTHLRREKFDESRSDIQITVRLEDAEEPTGYVTFPALYAGNNIAVGILNGLIEIHFVKSTSSEDVFDLLLSTDP